MQDSSPLEQRLNDLEIKASYTEDLLDQLNLTVYRQQQQIDDLARELLRLRQQVPEGGGAAPRNLRDERPPHYGWTGRAGGGRQGAKTLCARHRFVQVR